MTEVLFRQVRKKYLEPSRFETSSVAAASAVNFKSDSGSPTTSCGSVNTIEKAFVASNTLLLKDQKL